MAEKLWFRWRKTSAASLLALLMIGASLAVPRPFSSKPWLEDYDYVHSHIGRLYAELDWTAERGTPDLPKLDRETSAALKAARSDKEAQRILRDFIRAFGDGHLGLRKAEAPPLDPEPAPELLLSRHTSAEAACRAFSFNSSGEQGFRFRLDGVADFHSLGGGNSFAAGVLTLEGHRFGLLRIGSFEELSFRGACLREWPVYQQSFAGTCESECRSRFSQRVASRLLREIEWRIRQLQHMGSEVLVVDVSHNSGGDGWYSAAAQLFSSSRLKPLRESYVKNARTLQSLANQRRLALHYLATRNPAPPLRAALEQAICRIDDLAAEARISCDEAYFWGGRSRQAGCTRLTTRPLYSTGLLDRYDGPPLPARLQAFVFNDLIYSSARSAWAGPVVILIDERTASAAELFAGLLHGSAAVVLIGQPTEATGDGWSLGREPWILPHSKMQLYMPDTVAYWPDGANAREGLLPDLPVRWRAKKPVEMARQLVDALRSVDFSAAPFVTSSEQASRR